MIIGFLGKGGSGKTTLATLYTKYLLNKNNFNHIEELNFNGNRVLALDNDHNMDFKFNLGHEGNMNWMGQSLEEIFEKIAISSTRDVEQIADEEYLFNLNPADELTSKYSQILKDKDGNEFCLMVSGPHTNEMLYGNMCSHVLTTPLKVYLPLLKLNDHEYVIVDEKAGTDGVGTGVTTGFNLAVVVAEATTHGVKSAIQIIEMLKFYKTPFIVAFNKVRENTNLDELKKSFVDHYDGEFLDFPLNFKAVDLEIDEVYQKEFKKLFDHVAKISDNRKERTKERIKKQREFNESKSK